MARINISGKQGVGFPVVYPLINADTLFNVINTWNKQSGRHALEWGVDLHRNRISLEDALRRQQHPAALRLVVNQPHAARQPRLR